MERIRNRLRTRDRRVPVVGQERKCHCAGTAPAAAAAAAAETSGATAGGEQRARCRKGHKSCARPTFLLNLIGPPGLGITALSESRSRCLKRFNAGTVAYAAGSVNPVRGSRSGS